MRLKLRVRLASRVEDLAVTADANATVGEIATAIVAADPLRDDRLPGLPRDQLTLRIDDRSARVVSAQVTLAEAGVMSGQSVAIVADGGPLGYASPAVPPAATLTVVAGPDAGASFPLRGGANHVGRGRGNDVALTDPLVSKSHLRVNVGDQVDVADLGSANGVLLRGVQVAGGVLGPNDVVVIGSTELRVVLHHPGQAVTGATVMFNRSPTLDPEHAGTELTAPTPPRRPDRARLPMIPMIAPIAMGAVLFLITRNPTSVAFVALSPVMMIGTYVENRVSGKKRFVEETEQFRSDLRDLESQMSRALEEEGEGRRREFPPTQQVVAAVGERSPMLWNRRPDKRAFLELRLGLGTQPVRMTVTAHRDADTTAQLRAELDATLARYSSVPNVPVAAVLRDCGSLGVAGPRDAAAELAASAVMQIVGLHSPAEVVLAAMLAPAHAAAWDWLKWLPHTTSDHSPLSGAHLAVAAPGALVQQLEEVVSARLADDRSDATSPLPAVVVLVDDDAPFDRDRLVQIAERGAAAGVHLVWMAAATSLLPAACRTYIEADPATGIWAVGDVRAATLTVQVDADRCPLAVAEAAARHLAPVVDAGIPVRDDSSVPRRVAFLELVDPDLGAAPAAVVDQWRASNSLPVAPSLDGAPAPRRKDHTLRAFVGATAGDPFVLDLREHGPHALVGGTTGAGKSEFLQSWVLGMAAAHSPTRVNFLFVDYKGGAAFAECIHLPHCVGMVTDLSPYLVRRAIISLKAELKYREELLHRNGKAKDLLELERAAPRAAPPSLVIVVDEFAALVKEVPDFVDGVVDVAQRGRSLGLHLILATQRPAGVIRDNLRANTNLRIALRMADEDDSQDVVGTKVAAMFDPSIPGRGIAKVGPGRLTTFQTGYVGGWTTGETPPPVILVDELRLDGGARWEPPVVAAVATDPGPNDLKRLVETIRTAATEVGIPAPRKPWQPELAQAYELANVRPSRTDTQLVFGTLDNPAEQRQEFAAFWPDRDGNMAVYGTGGSGKSAFLRTLAVAAGSSANPCHVYALDFGGRGLAMLEPLPHVGAVIAGDDVERTDRLIRMLRDIAAERTERYAKAANAASITQYRDAAAAPGEARILVLIDNFGALRQAMETSQRQATFDVLQRLVADGRALGIHFVMTADRSAVIPPAVMASVQRRLVLRLAQDGEYGAMGVPNGQLSAESPPGRGSLDGAEVQVAVLGGVPSTARQSAAMLRLAGELAAVRRWPAAEPVPRLPDEVRLADLPSVVDGLPALGIADDTLTPVGFTTEDAFLLIGPPQAAPEQALLAMVQSFKRSQPASTTALLSLRRSTLANAYGWDTTVRGTDEIRDYLAALGGGTAAPSLLAVDGIVELSNSDVDFDLQTLLKTVLASGTFAIALGDSFQIGSAFGSAKIFKGYRNGLALLPEQMDGDVAFSTPFPRVARTDFRTGCGYLVRQGRIRKVLMASPS